MITSIPFGQPLLINDIAGGVPLNDWHFQENINDCRNYDNRLYYPFYATGDYISLQFTATIEDSDLFYSVAYKAILKGDSGNVAGFSQSFVAAIIEKIADNTYKMAWYFQAPELPEDIDEACFHLDITTNENEGIVAVPQIIATTQTFGIYREAPECSIGIEWTNNKNVFDFIYNNEIVSTPATINQSGWSGDDWVIEASPTKYKLPYGPNPLDALSTNISGLTIGGNYVISAIFDYIDNVSLQFKIGATTILSVSSAIHSTPFQKVNVFTYTGGTTIDVIASQNTSGAAFANRVSISSISFLDAGDTLPSVKQSMRLKALQWKPKYNEDKEEFKDSKGKRFILSASSEPVYELFLDEVPEYIHNALRLAKIHDTFLIDGIEYGIISKEYTPEWRNDSKFAQIRLEITKTNGSSIRSNC